MPIVPESCHCCVCNALLLQQSCSIVRIAASLAGTDAAPSRGGLPRHSDVVKRAVPRYHRRMATNLESIAARMTHGAMPIAAGE
jgi:hypothetical protein